MKQYQKPKEAAVLLTRLKSGLFQGRTNWLQHWNKKTKSFEAVDTNFLMMLMALRQVTKQVTNLYSKISR